MDVKELLTRPFKFPKRICLAAQHAERFTGCPAAVTLAQWALESNYGTQPAGQFNYWGIKWHPSSPYPYMVRNTHEERDGVWVPIAAKFINFPSLDAAFDYHGRLVTREKGPYSTAAKYLAAHPSDWHTFMALMAPIYATDKKYFIKLKTLIEHYRLQDFNLPRVPNSYA